MNETTTETPTDNGVEVIDGVAVDNQGMALTQPEEVEQGEAVQGTTDPVEDSTPASEPSDASQETSQEETQGSAQTDTEDEQLTRFAEAKGLTLDSDNAKKAAKMAMNAEKAMHAKSQRASELEKTMSAMSDESATQVAHATGQDPELLKRLQQIEVKDSIRDFFDANPDARQFESEMAEIAVSSGLYGSPEAILQASYAIAQSRNYAATKTAAKRETLENLAQKQQATVPRGNATTSAFASDTKITPQNVDRLVAANDQKWFEAHYDEINAALAG